MPSRSRYYAKLRDCSQLVFTRCKAGKCVCRVRVGGRLLLGLGVPVDHRAGADWYEKAAKQGEVRAWVALALVYLNGRGRTTDREQAAKLFVQAAEKGDPRGLYNAALMHLSGVGLPENFDRAETFLRGAAKRDHLPAIISLAEFFTRGKGVKPDLREAARWYQRAAELGDVKSQFIIGRLFATGAGVPNNPREAAKWFLRAAERGHATAAHNIAAYYARGTGVEQDAFKAVEWYKKAAAKGITASQVQLGKLLYSVDVDGVRDRDLAVDLLRKAAATGDNDAKIALAGAVSAGEDTARGSSRAKLLLKQAAESGHTGAALQLGHLLPASYLSMPKRLILARQSNGIRKPPRREKSKPNMPLACCTSTETA